MKNMNFKKYKIAVCVIALCTFPLLLNGQSYLPVPGDTSGYTPGSFQVTDAGSANYSIPIVIVPGTNGVQPSLALTYNSQGGNSVVGQGWSLQGISAIARTCQTYAQDGKALGISFTNTDRFSLDGERIIPVDSTIPYGTDGSEYRTEQNAFYQIHAYGTTTAPRYFMVRTNSGNIMEYGNTPDSRISVQGANTLFWLVNKISDTKGNYFTFSYFKDSISGEYYPTRIDYTGNTSAGLIPYASVQFTYELRPDSGARYLNGIAISANKHRLKSIKSFYGTTLVRAYYLTYNLSPANISQLVSLQECGSDGQCHTPTNFVWSNINSPSFSPVDFSYISQSATTDQIVSLDINADGVQDILKIPRFSTGAIQAYLSNKNPSALAFTGTPIVPSITVASKYAIADFNGDGKQDILLFDTAVSGASSFYINTDSIGAPQITFNLLSSPIPTSIFSNNQFVFTMDFNLDGRSDILSFDPVTGRNHWMFSNTTGTSGLSFMPNGSLNYFTNIIPDTLLFQGAYQPFFADFNGDGKTDILFYNQSNGNTKLYTNTIGSTPVAFVLDTSNFINPSLISVSGGNLYVADVNGDGLPDLLFYVKATGANSWWINKGNKTFIAKSSTPSSLPSSLANGTSLLQLDFNGDGFADLVWLDKSTGNNRWFKNDGQLNFSEITSTVISPSLLAGYDIQGSGNFTSRSGFDFFLFNNSATPKARILKGGTQYNNLISQIQVGSGQVIDVNYDYLTSDSVYSKHNNARYPLMDYQATQFVVKKWQTDNGVGTKSSTSYKYWGAKVHLAGRGFRGFNQIDVTDNNTGIVISRYFNSDTDSWKYTSSNLVRTTTKLPDGVIVSQTDVQNGLHEFWYNKCYYSFVTANSSKTFETDGTFVDSTHTTYIYDDYGNVVKTVTDYGDGHKDSLVNTFDNSYSSSWLISRLLNSHLYRMIPGHPTIIKASAFTYDMTGGSGLLTSEIVEPDSGSTLKVVKNYSYDNLGNIVSTSINAWNGSAVQTRTTHTVYDSLGRYVTSFTNAIGQVSHKTSEPFLGKVMSETDLNGLVKQYFYDGFGRLVKTIYPDGNWETLDYRKCGVSFSCPVFGAHLVYQQSSVAPPVIKYYDLLNRELRTQRKGFSGQTIYTDVIYNNKGQVLQESLPYFDTSTPIYQHYYYDIIGRKVVAIEPGARIDSVIYHGRTTISKNADDQTKTVVKNAREQMITATDNEGHSITYDYDAAGRLLKTTDPLGNNIIMTYDIHGNKTSMQDPDLGTYTYVTNGFGELIKQTDPLGHIVTLAYDSLGRLKSRNEPEGLSTWTYDNALHGVGMLGNVTSYDGYTTTYTYDTLSRLSSKAQTIDSMTYIEGYTYDGLGRVSSIVYPSGFGVTNNYNSYGYLSQVRNSSTGTVYWTASALNAKDEITTQLYGNGVQVNKAYDANTDFLTSVNAKIGGTFLQNMSFTYDALGNLQSRQDILLGMQENFSYDDLNRLTRTHVLGLDSTNIGYDILGNIVTKSDVGTYHYGPVNNGPHRVQSIDVTTHQCIPSMLVNTLYSSFNKVRQISKDSSLVNIYYNPDRMRILQKMFTSGALVRTKIYVSGIFEQEIKGGDTISTHYIKTPGGTIAAYTKHSLISVPASFSYFHRDHLGSTVMITDDSAHVKGRYSFDAWGKRRNADWSASLTDTLTLAFDRGFTGHEHYDLFDMVDMNGRVYDPVLGRFLSADPFIQDGTNLQCYNRYSYVCNNPLSLTDPTGYFSFGHFFSSIFGGIANAVSAAASAAANAVAHYASVSAKWCSQNWRTIAVVAVVVAVSVATAGGADATFGQLLLSGAAVGFAAGVTSTLLNGGNIGSALAAGLRGAVIGVVTAAATCGIGAIAESAGSATQSAVVEGGVQTVGSGVVQGGASVLNGGKFLNGFYSGAASSGFTNLTENQGGVLSAAIVGGTTSSLNGGKFADGAVTSAFQYMFTSVSHGIVESARQQTLEGEQSQALRDFRLDPDAPKLASNDFMPNQIGNYGSLSLEGDKLTGGGVSYYDVVGGGVSYDQKGLTVSAGVGYDIFPTCGVKGGFNFGGHTGVFFSAGCFGVGYQKNFDVQDIKIDYSPYPAY